MNIVKRTITKKAKQVVSYSIIMVLILAFAGFFASQTVYADTYMNSGRSGLSKPSMSELRDQYQSIRRYSALYQTAPVVSGNYAIATLSTDAYQSAMDWINYYRATAGLSPISFTNELNESAAYGALVNAANNQMSHYPSQPSGMSTEMFNLGYSATSQSNLSGYMSSKDNPLIIVESAIGGQMRDEDPSNVDRLGHRRWILNPSVQTMGYGAANNGTSYYSALRVLGAGVSTTSVTDYDFISWPASGNNLNDTFIKSVPWSITLNPQKYQKPSISDVTVTLQEVSTGKNWTFSSATDTSSISGFDDYFNINNDGYGVNNCIVFRPAYNELKDYYGDYIVTVSGLKDTAGSAKALTYKVTFEPNTYTAVSSLIISVSGSSLVYDGTAKTPSVTVRDGALVLTKGQDYTLEYNNNVDAGTGAVRITGTGRKYAGYVTKTFTIQKADQNVTVSPTSISLEEGGTQSIQVSGQQGSVNYTSSNTNVATVSSTGLVTAIAGGSAYITVNAPGTGNYNSYTQTIPVTVTRNATDISNCTITLASNSFTYSGSAKTPLVTVKDGTKTLVSGTDYTLSYANNINVGTATVTITGKGDYVGSVSRSYTITKADQTLSISPSTINIKEGATATIQVTSHGNVFYTSSDTAVATVASTGLVTGISAGSATITVRAEGDSNYNAGVGFVTVTVSKNVTDIRDCSITMTTEFGEYEGLGDYIYDGTAKIPEITVKNGSTTLVNGKDYTLSYANNVKAGTATVTISGIGNYSGTTTRSYTIDKARQDISLSSESISLNLGEDYVIRATGYGIITYTSNNTSIATVDSAGRVIPVAVGKTYITVKASGSNDYEPATKTVIVNVLAEKQPQSLTYSVCTQSLPINGTMDIEVGGYGQITYRSSNTSVATVDSSGKVTAKAAGNTIITVSAAGNSTYGEAFVTFSVTVENRVLEGQGICGNDAYWYFTSDGTLRIVGHGVATLHYQGASFSGESGKPTGGTMNWSEYSDRVKDIYVENGITELMDTLFSIDDNKEYYKASPRTISIADSVTKMGRWMFCSCDQLTSISIGSGLAEMGEECFWECYGLQEINVSNANQTYTSINGALYTKDGKTLLYHPAVTEASVVIPTGVTTLSSGSLRYMHSMTTLTIPASVTSIAYSALSDCPALKDVYYGGSESDWKAAVSSGVNSTLENATIHYGKTIPLTGSNVTLSQTSYSYDGNAKKPSVTVKNTEGVTLTEGIDYTVSYGNNINAGSATVTVTGTNAYSATVTKTFTITKANQTLAVSPSAISMNVGDSTTLNVYGKGSITYSSSDASVASVSTSGMVTAVAAGNAYITVRAAGDSNYNEANQTISVAVTKNAISLSSCSITLGTNSYIYDGSAKTPSVIVKDGTTTLIKGTHYSVTYNNNINAGSASVTITGMGDYTGTVSKAFTITKAVQTIHVSPATIAINVGDSTSISADGRGNITYSSSNTAVASVSTSGLVKGIAAGNTTITVKASGDSNYSEASQTIPVTVSTNVVSLNSCTITLDIGTYAYDGKAKTPTVTVKDGSTTLTKDTHYSVAYGNNIDAGTATVTISGMGNYSGTVTKTFRITKTIQSFVVSPSSISLNVGESANISASGRGSITYTSSNTAVATVNASGLVRAIGEGSATITVTASGDNNYAEASRTVSVRVTAVTNPTDPDPIDPDPVNLSTCTITLGSSSYTYDGTAKTPSVTVKDGTTTLIKGTHYSVAYSNNTNAGTATVTISGMGNYSGKISKTFTIAKANQTISVNPASLTLNVGENKTITASASGRGSITYSSSDTSIAMVSTSGLVSGIDEGEASITVRAASNSNYNAASKTVYVTVINPFVEEEPYYIDECDEIYINESYFTYTGSPIKPQVYVYDYGRRLTQGVDYVIESYTNNINAGEACVTIRGIGKYIGRESVYFDILPRTTTIAANNINLYANASSRQFSIGAVCTGNNKMTYRSNNDKVVVSADGNVLVKGKFCGQAVITITSAGTNNYTSATKSIYVNVVPTKVAWKSLKTPAKKKMAICWKKNIYADGYQVLYSLSSKFASKNKTITVSKFSTSTYTKLVKKLSSKKKYYVKIRAYKKVGSSKLYGPWSAVKAIKVK